jgi:hypothetical protein
MTPEALRHARAGASVYRQLRELRRALRAGDTLDALAAAARVHATAVRPNMQPGEWARAQAACERLLACIPGLNAPGYQPGLRRVVECLHADAARAAREGGDLEQAKLHLITRLGYLRDRHAPVAQQARALIDLAHAYIAGGETFTGGRMLADVGLLLTTEYPHEEDEEEVPGLLAGNSAPADDAERAARAVRTARAAQAARCLPAGAEETPAITVTATATG